MAERALFGSSPEVHSATGTITSALQQLEKGRLVRSFSVKMIKRHQREVVMIDIVIVRERDGKQIEMHMHPTAVSRFTKMVRQFKEALNKD